MEGHAMMKVLLIVVLIAVIAAIGWFVARNRHRSTDALPPSRPEALEADAAGAPPADIAQAVRDTLFAEPEPVAEVAPALPPEPEPVPAAPSHSKDVIAPRLVAEAAPSMEPEPVEPLPEPEPIVEPEPPAEPEPVIEPVPPVEPEPEPFQPDTEPAFEAGTEPPGVEPAGPEQSAPEHLAELEPEPEPVSMTHGDPLASEASEPAPAADLTNAEGELPAEHLDPHAGWEHPEDTTVHGDPESRQYHTPDSPGYNKVGPDAVDFDSEDAAQEAGFIRWDQPR
jgi:hypothetical protein